MSQRKSVTRQHYETSPLAVPVALALESTHSTSSKHLDSLLRVLRIQNRNEKINDSTIIV
eukprot:3717701-Pleurochrysis_carterae.AAC.1